MSSKDLREINFRVSDLIDLSLALAYQEFSEIHKKWISFQHRLAGNLSASLIIPIKGFIETDMLMRKLEAERLERMRLSEGSDIDLSLQLQFSISDIWMTRGYEIFRRAKKVNFNREFDLRIDELHKSFWLVRIPLDKGEIAGENFNKAKASKLEFVHKDGSAAGIYKSGDFILPSGLCGESGAAMWWAHDLETDKTVEICRQDISDKVLALFD